MTATAKLEARFWAKVDVGQPDECWTWRAATNADRYGRFYLAGRNCHAHRVSWELQNGPVAAGMHVLHRCDNPACVNPSHLWLGTHTENMADKSAKFRTAKPTGEKHPNAKLTELDVLAIRQRRAAGEMLKHIAPEYGVTLTTISEVARGRVWGHLNV